MNFRHVKSLSAVLALLTSLAVSSDDARAQQGPDLSVLRDAVREAPAEAPAAPEYVPPQALELNEIQPLDNAVVRSRAVEFTAHAVVLRESYGPLKARDGHVLLVLDTEWKNLIPLTLIYERQTPTEYQIPRLGDHLYVVAGGARLGRLVATDNTVPGHIPVNEFKLPRIGDVERGNVVFEVPSDAVSNLELRFYDYAHGHFSLPIVRGATPTPPAQPIAAAMKNEVVEIGIYALDKQREYAGQTAPAGMTFVIADVCATSQYFMQADATAFDPKARPGQKMKVGTVADWTDSRQYLQLVADGEYGYVPHAELTELPEAPRFLPDRPTGGKVVFLSPEQATSLELRCDFPNAKTPEGQVLRPKGLTLALEGKRPAMPQLKPVLKIEDDAFVVNVVNQITAESFAGHEAGEGSRYVVLDVTVNNRGQDGEFFQTTEQLKVADASGQQLAVDEATFDGVRRPTPLVWIPPGERRAFQVAYKLPSEETRPRLSYTGITKAEILELPRLAPLAASPTDNAPMPDAPAPTEMAHAAPSPAPATPSAPTPAPAPAAPTATEQQTITIDGKKFPARVPVRPNLRAKGLAGVGLTPEQVNEAIDRGAEGLWNYIKAEDLPEERSRFGDRREHVLAALALVHSGAHKKFPEFDAHLRKFLASFQPNEETGTYEMGLYCMLIESYGDPSFLPQMRKAARWLIETQGKEGTWGYGFQVADKSLFGKGPQGLRVLQVSGGQPLDGSDVAEPLKRVTPWDKGMDGDNSVSQYALLGLHAASRSRIKTDAEIWTRALKAHLDRQDPEDGGWAYHGPGGSYGSMTCAGLCALAIARHELGSSDPSIEANIERGLAWLSANFTVESHPKGSDRWLHYYLYSIERVGRILDTEFIGDSEWYPIGAKFLLGTQQPDGTWQGEGEEHDQRIASSFALLFLTRATSSLAEPQRSGPGMLKTNVQLPPGRKIYIILDASGSMLEEMDGKPKFEIAREAMIALVNELPLNTEVALRAYGYRLRAIEPGANEDSKLLVSMEPLGDKKEMLEILNGLRARGKTPLAYSLEQAKGELGRATEDSPITVLLLTDGGEDTQPRRDPIAAAAAFGELENVRLKIVGFDIDREDWNKQLQEMARVSGGQYLPAQQSAELMRELRSAVFETPDEFVLMDKDRKELVRGQFGQSVQLPAGKYVLRASVGGKAFEEELWINPGTTTAITFDATNIARDPGTSNAAPAQTAAPETAPKPSGAKFCTSCGAPLKAGAKFCTSCGAPAPQR